jgi:hypothetical protein
MLPQTHIPKGSDIYVVHAKFLGPLIENAVLCKIGGFHHGNYVEFCLVGYKNPLRTSQETHYVSATETSRLMLCKI